MWTTLFLSKKFFSFLSEDTGFLVIELYVASYGKLLLIPLSVGILATAGKSDSPFLAKFCTWDQQNPSLLLVIFQNTVPVSWKSSLSTAFIPQFL